MLGGANAIRVHGTFAGYHVRRHLGRGGMSDVYLVERMSEDGVVERCALKCILPRWADLLEHRALFQREGRIASTFRHPNIVRVLDVGEVEGTPYLVLEYVYGLDLRKLAGLLAAHAGEHGARYPGQDIGALPPALVVETGIGVAKALHAVHSTRSEDGSLAGYIHRDVAPANIILDYYGQARLADFGISKAIHAATNEISTTAAARGRAQYMAPELILHRPTRASDLFSLGVVLFEGLAGAGRHPFEDPEHPNRHQLGLMNRAAEGKRAFTVAEALPGLPSRLHALIERLIHPDPDERPTADATADELAAILPELGTDLPGAQKLARSTLRLVYTETPPSHPRVRAHQREDTSEPPTTAEALVTTGIQPSAPARTVTPEPAMDPKRATATGPLEQPTAPETPTSGIQPAHNGPLNEPDTARTPEPAALEDGAQFGAFTIVRKIAEGGMGATYAATWKDQDVERRVCLKTIRPELAANPQFREMFKSEAKTAAMVTSHGNLASFVSSGEHLGTLWIAYDYVDGATLLELLKDSRHHALPPGQAALIADDVARGLYHLHTRDHRRGSIVHRDVSLGNVMVDYSGRAVVIDPGVAKTVVEGRTHTNVLVGKDDYMAPEVRLQVAAQPTADQFALGVVLYRLLSGRKPFKGPHIPGAPLPPLPALTSPFGEIDPRWTQVVSRLLQPDPAHRYPSLAEMLEDLGPLMPRSGGVRLALGRVVRQAAPPKSVSPMGEALEAARDAVLAERDARRAAADAPAPAPTPANAPAPPPSPSAPVLRRDAGALQPGERFGEWVIEKKLGEGGMAIVYKASRMRTLGGGQHAALKLIRSEHAASADFLARFRSEVEIAMRLNHQNVVHVLDAGEVEGVYFMAMEFVEGCDVDSLVRALTRRGILNERRLPPDLAIFVGVGLLRGLEYAHVKGVIHRDVSPHNLMVTTAGEVKLTDFGVAKSIKADGMISKTQNAIGKPFYMPTEQYRGDPLDARADLFAAAVTIAEMLAGVSPYAVRGTPNETVHMVLKRIFENDRPHAAELAPHAPPELVQTLEHILQPQRDHRPASAEQVLTTLEPLVHLRAQRILGELVRAVRDEPTGPLSQSVLDAVRVSAPPPPGASGGTVQLSANAPPSTPGLAPSPGLTPDPQASAQAFTGEIAKPASSRTLVLAIALLALLLAALGVFAAVLFWPGAGDDRPEAPSTAQHNPTPVPPHEAAPAPAAEPPVEAGGATAQPSAAASTTPPAAAEPPAPSNTPAPSAPSAESAAHPEPAPPTARSAERSRTAHSTHRPPRPVAPTPEPVRSSPPPRDRTPSAGFEPLY